MTAAQACWVAPSLSTPAPRKRTDPPRSPPSVPPTHPMTRIRDPAPFQSEALPSRWQCAGAPGFFFFFNPFTLLFPPLDRQLALPDRPCSCAIQTPHSTPSEGNAWVSTHACWEPETPLPPQTSPVRWVLKDHATVRLAQSKAHASEQAWGGPHLGSNRRKTDSQTRFRELAR